MRRLEEPGTRDHRAAECAAFVSEELSLEDRLGERRAVQLQERLVRAPRATMDGVGEDLLADARLAEHEHAERARRDGGDERVDALRRLVAHHLDDGRREEDAWSCCAPRRDHRLRGVHEHRHRADGQRATKLDHGLLVRSEAAALVRRTVGAREIFDSKVVADRDAEMAARHAQIGDGELAISAAPDDERRPLRHRENDPARGRGHDRDQRLVTQRPDRVARRDRRAAMGRFFLRAGTHSREAA